MAYGPLELTPQEFYELTPEELYKMLDGFKWRERHEDERRAYWVANLMNCQLTKAVKPMQLLTPLYPDLAKGTVRTKEENDEFMKQFEEVLNNGNNSESSR